MNPGSIRTFYRSRRILLIVAGLSPVVLLAGVWALVTQVLMVPAVPGEESSPAEVVGFIIHEKGLPRLSDERAEAVFRDQVRRLGADEAFRAGFLREIRVASPEDQTALREHLLNVLKPMFMADIHQFHALNGDARRDYVDDRIVAYNRLSRALGKTGINASAAGAIVPDSATMLQWLMKTTTEEERNQGMAYFGGLQARITEILADADLTAEFEARIATPEQ